VREKELLNMRRLKFRVWHIDKKCWLPADKALEVMGFHHYLQPNSKYYGHAVVQQATGRVDRNGKDIFEGDIIKIYDTEDTYPTEKEKISGRPVMVQIIRYAKVYWNEANCGYSKEYLDWFKTSAGDETGQPVRGGYLSFKSSEKYEVINNIFEVSYEKNNVQGF
jgi:uncharacterized phage protein (TIGR01671 family)